MLQWHTALWSTTRERASTSHGPGRAQWLVVGVRRAHTVLMFSSASHTLATYAASGASRRRGGGAAPSVATAGRPRLERHCASQPRAPREQDEHTRRSRAPPTILALEPFILIPIYLVHAESLMFLYDRKRVFTPRTVRSRERYVDATDRDAAWPFYAMGRFDVMSLLNVPVPCCLAVNVFYPCTHLGHYDLLFPRDLWRTAWTIRSIYWNVSK